MTHRLLDQSLVDGALGHWTPNTNGNALGPRVMATDGTQLAAQVAAHYAANALSH